MKVCLLVQKAAFKVTKPRERVWNMPMWWKTMQKINPTSSLQLWPHPLDTGSLD